MGTKFAWDPGKMGSADKLVKKPLPEKLILDDGKDSRW